MFICLNCCLFVHFSETCKHLLRRFLDPQYIPRTPNVMRCLDTSIRITIYGVEQFQFFGGLQNRHFLMGFLVVLLHVWFFLCQTKKSCTSRHSRRTGPLDFQRFWGMRSENPGSLFVDFFFDMRFFPKDFCFNKWLKEINHSRKQTTLLTRKKQKNTTREKNNHLKMYFSYWTWYNNFQLAMLVYQRVIVFDSQEEIQKHDAPKQLTNVTWKGTISKGHESSEPTIIFHGIC